MAGLIAASEGGWEFTGCGKLCGCGITGRLLASRGEVILAVITSVALGVVE